jgi:hypothetical protein
VPVGVQIDMPVMSTTGWPVASTRVAPTVHWPVTHGPLPPGGTNAQPATAYGATIVATGWPLTDTRGFGAVGVACPPCEQSTVAPTWRIGPGTSPPQMTVRAPMFTFTVGPVMTIDAPFPFWM